MGEWVPARVIPVTGIDSEKEAEGRATSALLAVLRMVRDLSDELFGPMGASSASSATVETYIESPFELGGKSVRPDGLVRVSYGRKFWTALVEVKTGKASLSADQLNTYWDLARQEKFDCVVSISNEIAPARGAHPTAGLRVQANSPVKVHHISWTQLLTTAVAIKQHKGVDDPEQAWLLAELIRYLEHPASGALAFDDMGPHWVQLRQDVRDDRLSAKDEGPADIAQRWDQLLRYIALTLGADIGQDVIQVLGRKHRKDPGARTQSLVDGLLRHGFLDGTLRVPNTAGDIEVHCDLKAQKLTASLQVDLPEDRSGRARGTWLAKQLPDAPEDVWIEAYEKNARTPVTGTLAQLRDDRSAIVSQQRKTPVRAEIAWTTEMGQNRTSGGKRPSFTESVHDLIEHFYREVVQTVTPWQPSPSRLPDTPPVAVPQSWQA